MYNRCVYGYVIGWFDAIYGTLSSCSDAVMGAVRCMCINVQSGPCEGWTERGRTRG